MAGFSFYDWTLHAASSDQVELRQLGDANKQIKPESDEQPLTASVRAMLHWCGIVERLTRDRHARGARVYAGFERLSRVKPVLRRYQQLASVVDRLVVFGEHDEPLALDAEQIDVTGSALGREWFLVVYSENYSALLAAKDLDGFGPTGPLPGRRFAAVTVRERTFIERSVQRLERHIGERL
jgi:hypothetical protein